MHSENFEQLKNGLNLISLMTDKDCVSKFLKFYPDILDVYEKSRIKPQKFFTRLVSTETIEDLRKSVRLKNK